MITKIITAKCEVCGKDFYKKAGLGNIPKLNKPNRPILNYNRRTCSKECSRKFTEISNRAYMNKKSKLKKENRNGKDKKNIIKERE